MNFSITIVEDITKREYYYVADRCLKCYMNFQDVAILPSVLVFHHSSYCSDRGFLSPQVCHRSVYWLGMGKDILSVKQISSCKSIIVGAN